MEALKKLQNKIDGLNLRERGIVLVGIIVVIYFSFDLFVLQPLEVSQKRVQNQLVLKNAEVIGMNVQIQQIIEASSGDQQERDKQEIQRLRQESAGLDRELQQATANLVSPQQMAKLLQMILGQTDGLRLRKVTSLGSRPLLLEEESSKNDFTNDEDEALSITATTVSNAYKHGLLIEFDGNYFATLDYLRKLEQLEWNFLWDKIEYEVNEYPEASSALLLYTISLNENWIGV